MKIRIAVPVCLALSVILEAQGTGGGFQGGARARVAVPDKEGDVVVHGVGAAAGGWSTFEFISAEMLNGKTVKGAPYSAEAVTETIQTLADGNRITRRSSSMIYRDSEGRERREESFAMLGRLQNQAEAERTIFISDPVGELSYVLHTGKKTADKNRIASFMVQPAPLAGTMSYGPSEGKMIREIRVAAGGRGGGGRGGVMRSEPAGGPEQAKKESLGKRLFDGVEAEGTRTTVTIPAGEIGNERPIEIVSERWYSAELQTLIMSRHSDPRTGETVYKLTGINRSEPLPSLFEIPSDYTVNDRSRVLRVKPPSKDEI